MEDRFIDRRLLSHASPLPPRASRKGRAGGGAVVLPPSNAPRLRHCVQLVLTRLGENPKAMSS